MIHLLCLCLLFSILLKSAVEDLAAATAPVLHDERLEITLFAEDPDLVTPIGMAIDAEDRIFVLESHTHHPPKDYAGPKSDRVLLFVDADNDGVPERRSVFADGIHQGMNLAFSPKGTLYLVCAREVLALPDENQDGVCDGLKKILTLDTTQRYAHNSLLGITFDRDSWLYVARGNTGSDAWAVRGPDGSEISGYGDGGNVFRCRPDGTRVSEMATGFWNPFNLKFDMDGRLLLVDNDPDARGPNRLVHVVPEGDYGYKSVYGGGGNHPFQSWDGSLPGTLPYVAGTGEAPCDLIDCRRTGFPEDYHASVLATIWNEHTIERFELRAAHGTVHLKDKSVFLSGGKEFRPVALEADSRGNLFLTDWVLVDYPNHGRGRLWRIRSKEDFKVKPRDYFGYAEVAAIDVEKPLEDIATDAAFLRHAAIGSLSPDERRIARQSNESSVRLAALLADQRARDVAHLKGYLSDSSPLVKRAALVWAGLGLDTALQPLLVESLSGEIDTPMFEAYLAAEENLSGRFASDYRARNETQAKKLKRRLDSKVIIGIARDKRFSDEVRALALDKIPAGEVEKERHWIGPLALSAAGEVQLAAIRQLGVLAEPKPVWPRSHRQSPKKARRTAYAQTASFPVSSGRPKTWNGAPTKISPNGPRPKISLPPFIHCAPIAARASAAP